SIYARRYSSAGVSQGSEFLVAGATFALTNPSVASDGSGNFVVVWTRPSFLQLNGQRFDAAGSPLGAPFRVTDSAEAGDGEIALAASDAGFLVVWWDDIEAGRPSLFGWVYDWNGARVTTFPFDEFDATANASHPRVAANPNGGFVLVWELGAGGSDTE